MGGREGGRNWRRGNAACPFHQRDQDNACRLSVLFLHISHVLMAPLKFLFPLFPESLGYVRVAYVAAFKEIELEFLIKDNDGWPEKFAALKETAGGAKIQEMVQYEEMEEGEEGKGIG